jgi:capsular polysaccharide biosynthesis protein
VTTIQEVRVEIQEYFKILWRRGWIIVLLAVITAVSAYGFSKMQTPEYKGSIKLLFRPARADWGLQNAAKGLLPSYREFIKKDETADEVIDRLRLDMSRDSLLAKVTTSADEATFAIQIDARDYDPQVAGDIAWTFAQVFKEEQDTWNKHQDIRDQVEVYVAWKQARIGLFKPRTKINTLAGGIFGVMVGVVIVFFLEWLESDIVRTAEDVERHVGMAVVGSIPAITSEEVVPVGTGRKRRWAFLRSLKL